MEIINILFFFIIFINKNILAQTVINIWNDDIPYDNGDTAELSIFLPDNKKNTGRAIVMCPGGAYYFLSMENEGYNWVEYFNQQGIAVFIVKYRMPNGNLKVPVSDAEEAMRIVRRNSQKWNVNPKDVGIMGFSAGGHLASTIATHSKGDAKPNFHILFYPVISMDPSYTHMISMNNFLGKNPKSKMIYEYSNELQVTSETPRVFLALSNDDDLVPAINGARYYQECNNHGVPASMHIYPTGGHGWGYHAYFDYHLEMLRELKKWLQSF